MRKRYIYSFLFGVPGFLVSLVITFAISGVVAGFLWLYVYGDETWPAAAGQMLVVLFMVCFLALWAIALLIGFATGKRLEATPGLNRRHILVSVAATILPLVLILVRLAGNPGVTTDSLLCSEYCRGQGYSASGMPPEDSGDRRCSCFDSAGRETGVVPLDSVASDDHEE